MIPQTNLQREARGTPTEREPAIVDVAIAIVFNTAGELLICKRKADTVLGGYWEFPGGKCHEGEAPASAAVRETLEETGLTVAVEHALSRIEHAYPHAHVRLHPFLCQCTGGVLQKLEVAEAKWISPGDVRHYRFPEANASLVAQIAGGRQALRDSAPTARH